MKAEIVYNTKEEPRVLLTLESFEETARMAYEPDLVLATVEESVGGPTKLAYAICPTHAREKFRGKDAEPLSIAQRRNPAYAMGGGKSEADYQKFIARYEATVEEALDEVIKRDNAILTLRAQLETFLPPKCPTCKEPAENVGTEVTDEIWWCNHCEEEIG